MISNEMMEHFSKRMQAMCPYPKWKVCIRHGQCDCCNQPALDISVDTGGDPCHAEFGRSMHYSEVEQNEHRMDEWCVENFQPVIQAVQFLEKKIKEAGDGMP